MVSLITGGFLMRRALKSLVVLFVFVIPAFVSAALHVGVGKKDLTPLLGTPSAWYSERKGEGMEGVHDPLLALTLFIDNEEKKLALCSVDHLGFTYEMVQEIIERVHKEPGLEECEVYIASSHTHSGGGAYLNIPVLGPILAGPYNAETTQFYVKQTADAIIEASRHVVPGKIGIGYGKAEDLSKYRGLWPRDVLPLSDVAVIKVITLDDAPLAALFNYAVHPTVLNAQNREFSADFVGYARDHLQTLLGSSMQPIYFNGAQGDIIPKIFNEEDRFESCEHLGQSLAETVEQIWNEIEVNDCLTISTQKESYAFKPEATPFGLTFPIESYKTEMNIIVLNGVHAFITVPGELSTLYDKHLKETGREMGYKAVSIFGLTNDAHGYIILPESWKHKTFESGLSFGGENYGDVTKNRAEALLKNQRKNKEG